MYSTAARSLTYRDIHLKVSSLSFCRFDFLRFLFILSFQIKTCGNIPVRQGRRCSTIKRLTHRRRSYLLNILRASAASASGYYRRFIIYNLKYYRSIILITGLVSDSYIYVLKTIICCRRTIRPVAGIKFSVRSI